MVLRIGVLSFAHYHANFWCEAFVADDRVDLVGIWDDDEERLERACSTYATAAFEDLDNLLGQVDAVAICSETARHRPLIEAAAKRGVSMLCEKPLAATLDDAIAIERLVVRSGIKFVQSFPKRLDPASLEIRRLVKAGELGDVRLVRIRHGHSHAMDKAFVDGWWTQPEMSGGGTLIDEGVHAFDFLHWLFGEPESVQATVSYFHGLPVEDAALVHMRWSNGMLADVATSWSFAAAHDFVEIYGSEATALLAGVDLASRDLSSLPYLRIARRGSGSWEPSGLVPRFVSGGFHQAVARNFAGYLHRRRGAMREYFGRRRGAQDSSMHLTDRPAALDIAGSIIRWQSAASPWSTRQAGNRDQAAQISGMFSLKISCSRGGAPRRAGRGPHGSGCSAPRAPRRAGSGR